MRRFRRGNVTKVTALRPHFSFDASKEKSPRPVEKKNAWRDLCSAKVRPGISSDPAVETCRSSTGCAIHCADSILLRRKSWRGSFRWCKTERPIFLFPRVPLRYAHPRAAAVGMAYGLPSSTTAVGRSEAERPGREGRSFRFSTSTTAGLPRFAAESCRMAEGFSALGRRLLGLVGRV